MSGIPGDVRIPGEYVGGRQRVRRWESDAAAGHAAMMKRGDEMIVIP